MTPVPLAQPVEPPLRGVKVTVQGPDPDDVASFTLTPGEWLVITAEAASVTSSRMYPKTGTTNLVIKRLATKAWGAIRGSVR